MPLEVLGHTVPHWKALRYGKDGSREISCGSTSSICQDILKSDNLLHKRGFVKTQSLRTVSTFIVKAKSNHSKDTRQNLYAIYFNHYIFTSNSFETIADRRFSYMVCKETLQACPGIKSVKIASYS